MTTRTKEDLFQFLVCASAVDGSINDEERRALEAVRARLDLPHELAAEALNRVNTGHAVPILPDDYESLIELYDELIAIVTADGIVAPEEQALLDKVRTRLGLARRKVRTDVQKSITDRLNAADPGWQGRALRSRLLYTTLFVLILAAVFGIAYWIAGSLF